jgi:hypothetical protein
MTDKHRQVFWKSLEVAPADCTGKEQHLCKSIINDNPPKLLQSIIFVLIEITLSISLITKIGHLGLYCPIYPLVQFYSASFLQDTVSLQISTSKVDE